MERALRYLIAVAVGVLLYLTWSSSDKLDRLVIQEVEKMDSISLVQQPTCARIVLEECDGLELVFYQQQGESMEEFIRRIQKEKAIAIANWENK